MHCLIFISVLGAPVTGSINCTDQSLWRLFCFHITVMDNRGSIPRRGRDFFSSPPHPDRLCGPPNLLSRGSRGQFLRR